jgi:hypothetical protein
MKLANATAPAVVLSICLTASIAPADMMTMTYTGTVLTESVKFHCPGLLADDMTVQAGLCGIEYQGRRFNAFCVDADQYAGASSATEQDVAVLHNGSLVAYLYETYIGSATTATRAAALGVALWEVLYENDGAGFNASSGNFYITNNTDVAAAANVMLTGMPANYKSVMDLTVLHSESKQDMLIGGLKAVPEPTTVALLMLGAPLMLKTSRRRRLAA